MPILEEIFRQHFILHHVEFFIMLVKGIVHPKMKILSFTHPQVVPNLYEFVLPSTKEDILKNIGDRAVLGHR